MSSPAAVWALVSFLPDSQKDLEAQFADVMPPPSLVLKHVLPSVVKTMKNLGRRLVEEAPGLAVLLLLFDGKAPAADREKLAKEVLKTSLPGVVVYSSVRPSAKDVAALRETVERAFAEKLGAAGGDDVGKDAARSALLPTPAAAETPALHWAVLSPWTEEVLPMAALESFFAQPFAHERLGPRFHGKPAIIQASKEHWVAEKMAGFLVNAAPGGTALVFFVLHHSQKEQQQVETLQKLRQKFKHVVWVPVTAAEVTARAAPSYRLLLPPTEVADFRQKIGVEVDARAEARSRLAELSALRQSVPPQPALPTALAGLKLPWAVICPFDSDQAPFNRVAAFFEGLGALLGKPWALRYATLCAGRFATLFLSAENIVLDRPYIAGLFFVVEDRARLQLVERRMSEHLGHVVCRGFTLERVLGGGCVSAEELAHVRQDLIDEAASRADAHKEHQKRMQEEKHRAKHSPHELPAKKVLTEKTSGGEPPASLAVAETPKTPVVDDWALVETESEAVAAEAEPKVPALSANARAKARALYEKMDLEAQTDVEARVNSLKRRDAEWSAQLRDLPSAASEEASSAWSAARRARDDALIAEAEAYAALLRSHLCL